MTRRLLSLTLCLMLALTVSPALADTVTGSASAMGLNGEVTVTVELTDGVITSVTAEGAQETPGIGSVAIEQLPAAMAANNTINVDAVSGATITSNAILAAVRQALVNAGVNPDDYMEKPAEETLADAEYDVDVVIVGAGGAGMTAALTAADQQLTVLVLESQDAVGGNTVKSTGGMNAAKTAYQDQNTFAEGAGVEKQLKAAEAYAGNAAVAALAETVSGQFAAYQAAPEGYFDSVELFELDTIIGGKGLNDPALVHTLASQSESSIEWLGSIGIELHNVASFGGASVKRIHRPVDENGKVLSVGAYIVPRLQAACEAQENITILTNTTADEILMNENGAAAGVHAVGKTGNQVVVHARAVILATGGFGANLPMVASYQPALDGFMTTNAAGAQGQGIAMATAVGADTVDLDQIQIHPTVQADTAALITEGLRGDGAILVNAEGNRFIDEVGTRDVVSAAEIAQPGSFSWLIVDQKMADASAVIQGYIKRGTDFCHIADSYEALAAEIGIPAEAFAATMNGWNQKVAAKEDPDFGRVSFANPLDTAPYYAIKVTAGIHHTMGGIRINESTQVLRPDGTAISGLFAAGEVTGGVHGANRLGGNAVADIIVFGRIAGQSAAAYVK